MNQTQMISATILAWALFAITSCTGPNVNMYSSGTEVLSPVKKANPAEPAVPKPTLVAK